MNESPAHVASGFFFELVHQKPYLSVLQVCSDSGEMAANPNGANPKP